MSTFEKIEMFALSNRRFNKLSRNTKFIKIEVILLKIQVLQSVHFLLFSLYFTLCFVQYLRINLVDKMSLLLYWVTYTNSIDMSQPLRKLVKSNFVTNLEPPKLVSIAAFIEMIDSLIREMNSHDIHHSNRIPPMRGKWMGAW